MLLFSNPVNHFFSTSRNSVSLVCRFEVTDATCWKIGNTLSFVNIDICQQRLRTNQNTNILNYFS
ncbi:hypothetical protein HNQ38_000568 [Desulfovibrio intestinalis]|uniref:Uncharacterized protein n=1 Tax=Desulfovibrio intestinalis TaxID=58621 RepID=A0A7W8FF73_9BACT|nr:hypothetical protein [Desulfovibrio intestinalis]